MDEIRSEPARRRRALTTPGLEPLEGRRLMTASPSVSLGQVGIKEVTEKGGYTELDLTGTNKGDTITILDNGSSAAGNVTVIFGDGSSYSTRSGVSVVKLQGGAGSDNVAYGLTGPLTAARSVLLNLGNGNNHFTGNIAGAIDTTNGLDLEVYGGLGNDAMVVNQAGATVEGAFVPYLSGGGGQNFLVYNGSGNIEAGASVSPEFTGGPTVDTIVSNYSGRIDGNYMYNLSTSAGSGLESITQNVFVGPMSTGSVGISPTAPASIKAGSGNDAIRFSVVADPTSKAAVSAAVVAGTGKAAISTTSNVGVQGKITSKLKLTSLD